MTVEEIRKHLKASPFNPDVEYLSDREALEIASRLHVHMCHEYTEWSDEVRQQPSVDPGMEATIGNLANYLIHQSTTFTEQNDLDLADTSTHDPVNHPSHYTAHPSGIETIQITEHETFLRGNIIKYVLRAPYKGNELQDLLKAQWYLNRAIDQLKGKTDE